MNRSTIARTIPLHFVYLFPGFLALAAGLAESFKLHRFEGFDDQHAAAVAVVFIIGAVWQLALERLRSAGAFAASPLAIDLGLAAATLMLAANAAIGILSYQTNQKVAMLSLALFGFGALVALLAVQASAARNPEELADVASRWLTLLGVGIVGLGMLLGGTVCLHDVLSHDAQKVVLPWFLLTSSAALSTWVFLRFGAPTGTFRTGGSRNACRALAACACVFGLYRYVDDNAVQFAVLCSPFALLLIDMMRPIQSVRTPLAMVSAALAVTTSVGAICCLELKPFMVALAPMGIATSIALGLASFDLLRNRSTAHVGWLMVAAGMFTSAMLPLEVLEWISRHV